MDTSLKNSSNGNGHNGNRIYLTPTLPTQSLPKFEAQENDGDLHQVLSIIKRRSLVILAVATTVMVMTVAVTLSQKPVYESKIRILAEPVNSDNSNLPKLTSNIEGKLEKSGLDYDTQIQVLKSPVLMASIVEQLQADYPDITYDSLVNSLGITRFAETKIIEVSYRSNDPTKTQVVLNTVARAYLKYSLENRQTNLRQGIQFVEKQLPSIQKRVEQIQEQIQLFRQRYDFVDPDLQAKEIASQVNALSEQRLTINQQLVRARSAFNSIQRRDGAQVAVNDTALYQQLVAQIRQLEVQTAYELTRFQEDSVPIQDLQEKRQKLLPLLRDEAQRTWNIKLAQVSNEIQTLESQSQLLAQVENRLHQRVQQLPILARQYTNLQRSLQLANESLNNFLTTRQNLQIEVAQTQIPWQLVQASTKPQIPVSPDVPRSLILGFVASILLGIGSALLVEKLDNTYHTVESIKEKLKLPLLATIPLEKQLPNSQIAVTDRTSTAQLENLLPKGSSESAEVGERVSVLVEDNNQYESSKFMEALRVLHTNIQLLSSDQPIRSIVISSALPGEGKSTIAFYLAQTASAMGKRVLLVDADLRRPRIHSLSNLNNLWGLSSIISGNMPVETVMRQMPLISECSVITAGPIPPDPTKLLSSQKMKQLMAEFHQSFDLVIYDAPPLVGLADASLLASHTDGVVLVTRIHKTDRAVLTQALDNLKMTRSNILGMIVNGLKSKSYSYYYY